MVKYITDINNRVYHKPCPQQLIVIYKESLSSKMVKLNGVSFFSSQQVEENGQYD